MATPGVALLEIPGERETGMKSSIISRENATSDPFILKFLHRDIGLKALWVIP